jgi:hypothetical protein
MIIPVTGYGFQHAQTAGSSKADITILENSSVTLKFE